MTAIRPAAPGFACVISLAAPWCPSPPLRQGGSRIREALFFAFADCRSVLKLVVWVAPKKRDKTQSATLEQAALSLDDSEGSINDGCVGRMNHKINFSRMFFLYRAPLPLQEIDAESAGVEQCIFDLSQRWETYVKRLT